MPKTKQERITTVIFNDADSTAEISTGNLKWLHRMDRLVAEGYATEVPVAEGEDRTFEVSKTTLRIPFHRVPRSWTEEQREAARERLAAVREKVKAQRALLAGDEDDEEDLDEEGDEEDLDEEEEEEEAPEVIAPPPAAKKAVKIVKAVKVSKVVPTVAAAPVAAKKVAGPPMRHHPKR